MMQRIFIRQGGIPKDLTVLIVQDEATDGGSVVRAEIPDLPGCMSHGETPEEALQNLEEAFALYAEVLAEQGRPVLTEPVTSTSGTALESRAVVGSQQLAVADATLEELIPS